ncbi:hypothetical protein Z950_597 [Sulfitobacter mediterraneus KCTC 32188]|nr:hypothetical protein Z950_597 [Sulfitobacter mediterraneus KCTC 32188]
MQYLEDNEEEYVPIAVVSLSISFFDEGQAELKKICDRLQDKYASFEKQITVSVLSQSYKNFHSLTGLTKEQFYKPAFADNRFDRFFDEI